jgi:tetratricopeptide (TPR) repeat protein
MFRVPCARALPLAVACALVSAPARADVTAEQRAAAQVLFDDARQLMTDKRYAEAGAKLEESLRLDPALGTLLNLAECQSQLGKTASAWANFQDGAFQAKSRGDTKREALARAKAAALEPRLSTLKVNAAPGAEIRRDGALIAASALTSALPVDPGEHVISASAPGKKVWQTRVVVKDGADRVVLDVPALEPDPAAAAAGARRIGGTVLLVAGAGGLVTSAVFTGLAKSKYNDSLANGCNANNGCNQVGFDLRNEARARGNVATAALIAGGVVAAGGLGLVLSALPRKPAPSGAAAGLTVDIDPRGNAWLGWSGRF